MRYFAFECLTFGNAIVWDASGRSLYQIILMRWGQSIQTLADISKSNQHLRCCAIKLVRCLVQLSNHVHFWGMWVMWVLLCIKKNWA